MYKCMVKSKDILNSIWQTHATVDLCVSVFSTDMHSSCLGVRPGGFLCRHKLSYQCALHKHHNLNNLGIRQGNLAKHIRKNRFCFCNYSEKLIFIMQGRLHTLHNIQLPITKVFSQAI